MTRATKYVALDVHQATTLASVRTETGQVIARSVLPTAASAVVEFFRGMRGTVHVVFEEGTQAQWLYDLLVPLVHRVVVCDRHGEKRRGNNGDRVDADGLSARLWRGELRAVYHGSAERATLKELTRSYRNLVEDATRVMLRLKALPRSLSPHRFLESTIDFDLRLLLDPRGLHADPAGGPGVTGRGIGADQAEGQQQHEHEVNTSRSAAR